MNGTLDWLKKHWFIIVALCTMSAAYGRAELQLMTQADDIAALQQTEKDVAEIKGEVKGIREDVKIIKEHLLRGDG
jgi:hypothetical protein